MPRLRPYRHELAAARTALTTAAVTQTEVIPQQRIVTFCWFSRLSAQFIIFDRQVNAGSVPGER
jgi:hypothetical protein